MASSIRVIILAAQRKGLTDPLAQRFGVSHKCLVPLQGRPLIAHVADTVSSHPMVESIAISVEFDTFAAIARALDDIRTEGDRFHNVIAADNIADSVILASRGHEGPIIVTTGDNALLSHASIDAMVDALERGDVAIAMARKDSVLRAHPRGQRRFYAFRDGEYSNCNLYGLASSRAFAAAEIFRGGGQFAKKVNRIIKAFGLLNLFLLRTRAITLEQGLERIARRIGLSIGLVILPDGTQAIDVDNDRTYDAVSSIIEGRSPPALQQPPSFSLAEAV